MYQETKKAATKAISERCHGYFKRISTEEFAHPPIPCVPPTHGPVQKITVEETEAVLKEMKPGKATGPDDMAADLWKLRCWSPARLAKFFNQVVTEKKVPDCTNYRPIRSLLLHLAFLDLKAFDHVRLYGTPYDSTVFPKSLLNDIVLTSEEKSNLERQAQAWYDHLALNVKKSEYLKTDVNEAGSIEINGTALVWATNFKYLGSAIASNGVSCDRKIPERIKSKIYRTIVTPVAMYGAHCCPVTKEDETRLTVKTKTKMLRWTAGVTRLDHIRKNEIRQGFGVAPVADKLPEARFRWYVRANGDTVRKNSLNDVPWKRPKGWPKQSWLDTLHVHLKVAGIKHFPVKHLMA
ncbi:unnamed protein product [Heligmosomoides polygyrus]|uniref:DDE-1 domain-containing protein n=1 Tax=Heligmosomoides polygyrus TaxID=6339 RepID=A0A183FSM8_HELPZ|nr:unnamed protein product [Heligmosomoides polygyrus]